MEKDAVHHVAALTHGVRWVDDLHLVDSCGQEYHSGNGSGVSDRFASTGLMSMPVDALAGFGGAWCMDGTQWADNTWETKCQRHQQLSIEL